MNYRKLLAASVIGALCMTGAFADDPQQDTARDNQATQGVDDRLDERTPGDANAAPQRDADATAEQADTDKEKHARDMPPMTADKVLNKIYGKNLQEIKMGELALTKASSDEVKEFAQTLIEDHKKANEKVQQVAQEQNIELKKEMKEMKEMKEEKHAEARDDREDRDSAGKDRHAKKEDHKAKMEKLQGTTGEQFDKAFMQMMARDHDKTIKMLNQAQRQVESEPVKNLIAELLPALQKHEQEAIQIASSLGVNIDDAGIDEQARAITQ